MDLSSSSLTQSKQAASLSELLQEEQEPFELEAYLFQTGYYYYHRKEKRLTNLEGGSSSSCGCFSENCCSSNTNQLLKRLDNKPRRRRSSSISAASEKCLNIATTVLKKVVFINKFEANAAKCTSLTEDVKLSSTSVRWDERSAGSRISSESDDDGYTIKKSGFDKADKPPPIYAGGHLNHLQPNEAILLWKILEQNRDCAGPVSVLDQIENAPVYSDGKISAMRQQLTSSSASRLRFPMEGSTEKEFVLSPSLWELLLWSPSTENPDDGDVMGRRRNACCFQYINSNKVMQQSNPLKMSDCDEKRLMLPGEIGCDNSMIKLWGKQDGERKKKLTQVIRSELVGSLKEWCALLEGFGREIGKEIVDRILEAMKDELVGEMMMVGVLVGNG